MEKKNQKIIDSYDYLTHAASSQDCTGLIQIPAFTPEDVEHYEEIYPFLPPQQTNITEDQSI